MPSGDESFTTIDTSLIHFKQIFDMFSINIIHLFVKILHLYNNQTKNINKRNI